MMYPGAPSHHVKTNTLGDIPFMMETSKELGSLLAPTLGAQPGRSFKTPCPPFLFLWD